MTARRDLTTRARWRAVVTYRSEHGPVDVEHWLRELHELHDLVEAGPHWDTIEGISVERANPLEPGLTVEKAAEL